MKQELKNSIQQLYKIVFLSGLCHLTFSIIFNPNKLNIINWFIGLGLTLFYFISH